MNRPAMAPPPVTGPIAVVDVGGTDTKSGLALPGGTLEALATTPTPIGPDVAAAVVDHAVRHTRAMQARRPDLAGVGIIVPGIVDDDRQVAVWAANLAWRDTPFSELVGREVGLPVRLGHDVSAAGLAELRYGAAQDCDDAAMIVIGTGIAAALFSEGRPIRGHGFAGELGHAPLIPGGATCACGGVGCVETVASAGAIARRYNERTGSAVAGAEQVLTAAKAGDGEAQRVWHEAAQVLAQAIAQLAAILAPPVVVLGGGLSRAGSALLDPVTEHLRTILGAVREPELRLSTLGTSAGLLGAGLLGADPLVEPS